jgi:hypothetical protein
VSIERGIVIADVALVEADGTDIDHPARRLGIRILGVKLEHPIGFAIGQALQIGARLGQVNARDNNTFRQQRQR